jgi:hypothetical protein
MQLSICFRMHSSMEVVDMNVNETLLGQYFDSCLGKYVHVPTYYSSSDFRRTCINEKILSSIELCAFCRVVRMVEMIFEVICSVYIEVTKFNMTTYGRTV